MGKGPCFPKEGMSKGAWTAIEDQILKDYVKVHGEGKWGSIPKRVGLKRCGKSCRLRWLNYLRPNIKRGNITTDEDDLIIRLHNLLGNRWSIIAGRLPGRTDNEIKNYWNTNLSKRAKGIQQPITNNTKKIVSTICATSNPAPANLSVLQKKAHEVSSTSAVVTPQVLQLPNHYQYFNLGDNVETVEASIPNPLKNDGVELSVLSNEEGISSKLMGDYGLGDINILELLGWNFTLETRYSAQALLVPEEYWSTMDEILKDKVDEDFGTLASLKGSSDYEWIMQY